MIVFRLIHHNYPFFNCAAERMYLTSVNTNSNLPACSSPTDGAKIMSNDALLRTSVFCSLSQKIQYLTTLISLFKFPNGSIN